MTENQSIKVSLIQKIKSKLGRERLVILTFLIVTAVFSLTVSILILNNIKPEYDYYGERDINTYLLEDLPTLTPTPSPTSTPTTTPVDSLVSTEPISINIDNLWVWGKGFKDRFVFVRGDEKELNIADISGEYKINLGLKNVVYAHKRADSELILATTFNGVQYRTFVINILNKTVDEIFDEKLNNTILESKEDKKYLRFGVTLQSAPGLFSVTEKPLSPDGKQILYREICGSTCKKASDTSASSIFDGYYIYNIETKQSHKLPQSIEIDFAKFFVFRDWDKNSKYIYGSNFAISTNSKTHGFLGNVQVDITSGEEKDITNLLGTTQFTYNGDGTPYFTFKYRDQSLNNINYPLDIFMHNAGQKILFAEDQHDIGITMSLNNTYAAYFSPSNTFFDEYSYNSNLNIAKIAPFNNKFASFTFEAGTQFSGLPLWVSDTEFLGVIMKYIPENNTVSYNIYLFDVTTGSKKQLTLDGKSAIENYFERYLFGSPCGYTDVMGMFCEALVPGTMWGNR